MKEPQTEVGNDARVAAVLSRYREPVLEGMRAALDRADAQHTRFMRYHLGWEDEAGERIDAGGKMLRPALCLLCCEASGDDARRAMPAAVALELLHNFTLIHDDIEDASETRHGRPTLWRVHGIAQAINAGDGMFVLAQRTLLDLMGQGIEPARVITASKLLNDACVALCEGQYLDLGFESRASVAMAEYEAMIGGKTAALLGASAALGALCGGADDGSVAAFQAYGSSLGLAFQIQDDVLGTWGEPHRTGKPAGDDIRSKKKSFPAVYALEHLDAERRAELERLYGQDALSGDDVHVALELIDASGARGAAVTAAQRWSVSAIDALAAAPLDAERRAELEALAAFAVQRHA